MDGTGTPPTTSAATAASEPEIIAGISSAQGQPATLTFEISTIRVRPGLLLAVALVGVIAGIGVGRLIRPAG